MATLLGLSLAACSSGDSSSGSDDAGSAAKTEGAEESAEGSSDVANKDKPLVWFNRQPSNSSTGELDMAALTFNDSTYYVGFDANQGAELQGTMIKEYIENNIDKIDRNGDGVIGYVLAIGDIGHNDSIARTRGVRKALGTGVEKDGDINSEPVGTNADGSASAVQDGTLEIGGKKYTVRELASQNLDIDYSGGDGQTESNVTNRLGNPGQYDAFAINMVKTDNAASYTALLSQ